MNESKSGDADASPESITKALWRKARCGDGAAFEELFALHGDRLLVFVRSRMGAALREKVEADDVLQDAYLAALKSFDGINVWHAKKEQVLTLVKARLEVALEGGLPEDQKLTAEEILANVNLAIADGAYPVRYHPEYLYKIPSGNADELQRLLHDETTAVWNRARAGIALGRLYENQRQVGEATAVYRQAYELARSVYPMYAGVKDSVGGGSRIHAPDAKECTLIQELVGALHRLDPKAMPLPKGRIEFDVVGISLPPTVHIDLVLKLFEPSIVDPREGLAHSLPRLLPLRQDRPVSAVVLDGTYRLDSSGLQYRWDHDAGHIGPLVQLDVDDWPREITVQGDVVKLPPIRLRLAEAIDCQSPADGESIDLSDAELRWEAVPDAEFYRLHLSVRKELPRPTASMFLAMDVKTPRLRFASVEEDYHNLIRSNLVTGSVGEWRVDAYDADGRCIGRALDEQRFLVAGELHAP